MKNSHYSPRVFCLLLLLPTLATATVETKEPSFTALYRYWHEPSETLLDEARVTYSSKGLRVEQLKDDSGNVFIANYAEHAFWFLDRKRHLVHSIPVLVTSQDVKNEASSYSIIQSEPCEGFDKVRGDESVFQGRAVQRWQCLHEGELFEEHWYAKNPGVVVRVETRDGFVSELTEVHQRHAAQAYFRPPSHYRTVEIEELINPAVPISSYREKPNGQP